MIKANWTDTAEKRLRFLADFLAPLNLSPHAVTIVGVTISLGGAVAFALGHLFLGALWVVLGGICDLFDGVIARRQDQVSTFGGLLDSVADRVVDISLLLGLAFHFGSVDRPFWVLMSYVGLVGSVLVSYVKARGEVEVSNLGVGFLERGERIGLLALGGFFGVMPLALTLVAVGSWLTVFQRMALAYAKMRELDCSQVEKPADQSAKIEEDADE
jgi:phosphatidylglycerophosphate synthase